MSLTENKQKQKTRVRFVKIIDRKMNEKTFKNRQTFFIF